MKKVAVLGSSWSYMAVLFDLCSDTLGAEHFSIYKNIRIEGKPDIHQGESSHIYQTFEPGVNKIGEYDALIFGVTGPWGKYSVFHYFKQNHEITEENYTSIVHPQAYISTSARFRNGLISEPLSVISSQVTIGFGVSIKRSVSVGHHVQIEDFAELNPGVTISSNVKVCKGAIIGSGAVLKDGITIGANTVIGMGSVVTKDIPDGVVAFGNPCKVVKENQKPHV